jgi:hypothetical protein
MGAHIAAVQVSVKISQGEEWPKAWSISPEPPFIQPWIQQGIIFPISRVVYERVKDFPSHVTGFADITLVERTPIHITPGINNYQYVPGAGVCNVRIPNYDTNQRVALLTCLTPWSRAKLGLDLDPQNNRSLVTSDECAPWPTGVSFVPGEYRTYSLEAPYDLEHVPAFVVNRPVAHIRRHFDFRDLRLYDFLLRD